jgi:hypothetical protein
MKGNLFLVTVGFVGRFDHFRHSALFLRRPFVEPTVTIDWSQIPVGILKKPLLRWIF